MRDTITSAIGCCLIITAVMSRLAAAADLPLAQAVKEHRDVRAVQTLLKQGAAVNTPLADGTTALHWASQWDDAEMVAVLLAAGARADGADDYGVTPLWLASTNGSPRVVELLLKAGGNPNAALPSGETVLERAAHTGSVSVITQLLGKGATVNAKDNASGQTPLMMAAAQGHVDAVRTLLQRGANVHDRSKGGYTPFLLAARDEDSRTAALLLEAGADVNEAAPDGTTALVVATLRGNVPVAKFLLDKGADPNLGPGFTPLHWVVGRWHYGEPRAQANGGRIDEDSDWRAFEGLQGPAKIELVKALLAHGANPNARATREPSIAKGPVLGAAARPRPAPEAAADGEDKDSELPKWFTRPKGPVRTIPGGTPFLVAAKFAEIEVMQILLDAGADPSLVSDRNVTPLMAAAGIGSGIGTSPVLQSRAVEAMRICLELGNDINVATPQGETAMHGAGYRGPQGSELIMRFLVEHGANINAKNWLGWTPLAIVEGLYFGASNTLDVKAAAVLRSLGAQETPQTIERQVGELLGAVWNQ